MVDTFSNNAATVFVHKNFGTNYTCVVCAEIFVDKNGRGVVRKRVHHFTTYHCLFIYFCTGNGTNHCRTAKNMHVFEKLG